MLTNAVAFIYVVVSDLLENKMEINFQLLLIDAFMDSK